MKRTGERFFQGARPFVFEGAAAASKLRRKRERRWLNSSQGASGGATVAKLELRSGVCFLGERMKCSMRLASPSARRAFHGVGLPRREEEWMLGRRREERAQKERLPRLRLGYARMIRRAVLQPIA